MWWGGFATGALLFGFAGITIGGIMGFMVCREMQEECELPDPKVIDDADARRERWLRGEAI
jgi:hypothetical protein